MGGDGQVSGGAGIGGAIAGALRTRRGAAAALAFPATRAFQVVLLAAGTFLIVFQGHAMGPLIPMLSAEFGVPAAVAGLLVPAYSLPYSVTALVYGPLSDRLRRGHVILFCLGSLTLALMVTGLAPTLGVLLGIRVAAGAAAGGVVPVSIASIGDLYAYHERGRPIGFVFAALTAGLAAGLSLGPGLAASVGWRGLYLGLAALAAAVLALSALGPAGRPAVHAEMGRPSAGATDYRAVLALGRARRVYALMLAVGACTYGSIAWFGLYANAGYGVGGAAIGAAYLAYGAVCTLSPFTGALADRVGQAALVPAGFAAIALGWLVVALRGPFALSLAGLAAVALGHQLTYPPLAAIASELAPEARGRAMAFNTFSLFLGISGGSLLIGALQSRGFDLAFGSIALIGTLGAIASLVWLRGER